MPIQKLINYFGSILPLSDQEIEAVARVSIERKIKRRQFILQDGDRCRHYTFVVSGCFKMYSVDPEGKEHNLQFGAENAWLTDMASFHSIKPSDLKNPNAGIPSRLYIEAIEPSSIIQIGLMDLVFLFENFPKFNRIFRIIIENNFIELQERVLQNISCTAEQRYCAFLNQYPELSKRLPNTQIASFLGITPEFLSSIRKTIANR
ncbi:Crp/Fnr family transcriptional regulator [Flavobacterium macacae]|uniref:Crp/Fnr family transcriptional regulator n=1 Tax=Flavobacterium macacae TaxID=2488993 RepID=A0A3P3WE43_9FLAO|nr:Crp/Fnr family transcriptional regulator [Flavobacterium macacae]RRJ90823.1 Crp/Fnr family transcriptional regulator [Flavobacterium macacae]